MLIDIDENKCVRISLTKEEAEKFSEETMRDPYCADGTTMADIADGVDHALKYLIK